MKVVYLAVLLIFVSEFALAQDNSFSIPQKKLLKLYPTPGSVFGINPSPTKIYGLSNWDRIYALPQDNMPCLIPDLTTIAAMPTFKYFTSTNAIPNPYKQTEIIPNMKDTSSDIIPQ